MVYGNTFEEAKSGLSHPEKEKTESGYKIEAVTEPDFSLRVFSFIQGYKGKFSFKKGVYFVEKGSLIIKNKNVGKGKVIIIDRDSELDLESNEESLIYLFTSPDFSPEIETDFEIKDTFDIRDKYWGKIESIVSEKSFAGKRMFMNAGTQSSLEYHVNKKECYFLQEGKLKVGIRIERAENKSIVLQPGDVFIMHPGLMHMRICLEDCVIIEISTKDEDSDSHLVEDGQKYMHKETED